MAKKKDEIEVKAKIPAGPKNKIVVETKIKSCNVKANGESLTFEGISLTEDQREKVIAWVKEKETGRLTFAPLQEKLPGTE